jgi:hypothetical protein
MTPTPGQMPTFKAPHGLREIQLTYGVISVKDGVVQTAGWEARNMISVSEVWLPRKADGSEGHLYVNKKTWPLFKAAFEECLALGDGYQIRTLGCFAPRLKRVNGDLSTHSWGISMDLNADRNPLQSAADHAAGKPMVKDIPDTWIHIFKTLGFTWGGDFSGRKDPQHLQFASGY